jgi:tetratricopeptide (TPR) repeat protein
VGGSDPGYIAARGHSGGGGGDPARRLADAAELARRLRTLPQRRAAQARAAAAADEAAATKRQLDLARARRGPVLALLGVMLVGFAATTGLYVRADRAQGRAAAAAARANAEAARASAVTSFLTDDLFSAANPLLGADPNIPVKKVLGAAAADIDRRFAAGSVDRAAIQAAIGGAYAGLADSPRGVPLLRAALGTLRAAYGEDAPQTQSVRLALVDLAERTADMKALRQAGQDLLATHPARADTELRGRFAVEEADCLTNQNDSLCVSKLRPFLAEVRTRLGPDSQLALRVQVLMAYQLGEGQHFDQAITLARQTVRQTQAQDGADSVPAQDRRYYLGQILMEANQLPEAIAILTDVRRRLLDIFGTETEMSARAANQLGRAYTSGKNYDEALRMLRIGYDYNLKTHGEAFHLTRFAMHNLAKTLTAMGRPGEAVPLAQRAFDQQRAAEGADNEDTLWIEATLADCLLHAGEG